MRNGGLEHGIILTYNTHPHNKMEEIEAERKKLDKEKNELQEDLKKANMGIEAVNRMIQLNCEKRTRLIKDRKRERDSTWADRRTGLVRIQLFYSPLYGTEYGTKLRDYPIEEWPETCFDQYGNVLEPELRRLDFEGYDWTETVLKAWKVDNTHPL